MNDPIHSVRIVIFDENNPDQFLTLSESDDPTNVKLPGGKFEDEKETPLQATKRELQEELGIAPDAPDPIQVAELTNDDGISKRYIFYGKYSPAVIKPSAEISQILWVTESTIPDGKNKQHILSAVASCKQWLLNNKA